jgi:lysophospholipase L1-like esterase
VSLTHPTFAAAPLAPVDRPARAASVALLLLSTVLVCALTWMQRAPLRSSLAWAGAAAGPLVVLGASLWCVATLLALLRWRRPEQAPGGWLPMSLAVPLALAALAVLWAWVFRVPSVTGLLRGLLWGGGPLALGFLLDRHGRLACACERWAARLPTRWSAVAPGLALSLASVLLVSTVAEAVAQRWIGQPTVRVDAFGTRPDLVVSPYVMFGEQPSTAGGELNAQGFFGPEFAPVKHPDERRVAILGGSVVWAGKDGALSIAADLEARLNRRCPGTRVRVANFGRRSYVSMQELILLQRDVLPLEVDLVIVLDGFNDLWIPWRDEPEGVGHPFLFSNLRTLTEVTPGRLALGRLRRTLESHSAFVAALTSGAARPAAAQVSAPDSAAMAREYGRNLYQMALLARAYGARVLLAPQPWVGSKQPMSVEETAYLTPDERQAFAAARVAMVRAAAEAAQRAQVAFADSADVFDGLERTLFDDPVHVAGRGGNTLLARFLARRISSLGLLSAAQGACLAPPSEDPGPASRAGS